MYWFYTGNIDVCRYKLIIEDTQESDCQDDKKILKEYYIVTLVELTSRLSCKFPRQVTTLLGLSQTMRIFPRRK